mgnify:CR=1 FL=1
MGKTTRRSEAGEYKDLITYQTEEGADVLFEADFTVKEPENKKAEDHENNEQTDPGETSDPAAEKNIQANCGSDRTAF